MPYIQTNELPAIVQRVLSSHGYGKKDIEVEAKEKVSPYSSSGDGYRCFMVIINLFTEETSVKYGSWGGANSFNPNNQVDNDDKYYVLPENFCVIEGREGGNHPIHARMIVRPDMISKYLPAKTGITERQQYIIDVLGCLTSAGRKEEFNSYGHIPPSKEEYAILENLGLIKITKAGAVSLTTEGKNNRSRSGMLKYVAP